MEGPNPACKRLPLPSPKVEYPADFPEDEPGGPSLKKAAEAPPPPPDGAVPGRDAVPGRRRASEPGKGNAAEEADGGPADGEGMEAETTAARGGSDWPVGGLDEDEPGRPS